MYRTEGHVVDNSVESVVLNGCAQFLVDGDENRLVPLKVGLTGVFHNGRFNRSQHRRCRFATNVVLVKHVLDSFGVVALHDRLCFCSEWGLLDLTFLELVSLQF